MDITRELAASNIELFAKEGRLVQSVWHCSDDEGRELACLLGAIHPNIDSAKTCPASVMPSWMAELLPTLFDGVRAETAIGYGLRFADALRRGNTDDSVLRRFLIRTVESAVKSATPKGEAPAYWQKISDACANVCELLRRNASKDELDAAAYVAADAVAYAAAYAAADAARAAAHAAADAARAAAHAAADAVAYAAAYAAHAAAYERLFDVLMAEMLRGVA